MPAELNRIDCARLKGAEKRANTTPSMHISSRDEQMTCEAMEAGCVVTRLGHSHKSGASGKEMRRRRRDSAHVVRGKEMTCEGGRKQRCSRGLQGHEGYNI